MGDKKGDIIISSFFIGLAAFFLIGALFMPVETVFGKYAAPGLSPIFFSSMVILLCLIVIFRKRSEEEDREVSKGSSKEEKQRVFKLLLGIFFCIVYIFLLGKVEFIVLTSVFLAGFSYVFYRRKPVLLAAVAVLVTLGVYYLFSKVFLLPLP